MFIKLKEDGYHIAIDTNGSIINDDVIKLLEYTDLVLLDVKMTDEDLERVINIIKKLFLMDVQ